MINKLLVFFISAVLLFGCAKKTEAPVEATPAVTTETPAPPTEAPAVTTKNAFEAIDEQLKNMLFGNIAFNTPKTINIDSTKTIQLKLDLNKSIDELKNTINVQEEKAGAQIKVSNQMEARLTGQNFSITPLTPETQAISSNETTEWIWRVKPTAEGNQDLNLTLSAILDVNGKAIPRKVEVFVKVIEVKVTAYQKMQLFVENNWQWLWATLVIPIAGWLWRKKK